MSRVCRGASFPLLLLLFVLLSAHVRLAAQGARYQSAHFILLAPPGSDPGRLLDELESAYRDLRAFGLKMPSTITARSYGSTAEFMRGAGASSFNLGVAIADVIHLQPVALLLRRGDLRRTLRHELAHVGMVSAARRGLPRWMNEGMAMVAAAEKQPERLRFLRLDRLELALSSSRSHDTLRSAYGTAERLVSGLIATVGKGKLLGLLREVAGGSGFEERFALLTGLSPEEWGARELGRKR